MLSYEAISSQYSEVMKRYYTYGSSALLGLLLMVNTIEKTEDKQLFTYGQLKLGNIFSDLGIYFKLPGYQKGQVNLRKWCGTEC